MSRLSRWAAATAADSGRDSDGSGDIEGPQLPVIVRRPGHLMHQKVGYVSGLSAYDEMTGQTTYEVTFDSDSNWFGDPTAVLQKHELYEDIYEEYRPLLKMLANHKKDWLQLNRIAAALRRLKYFGQFTLAELKKIAKVIKLERCFKHDLVFKQNADSDKIFRVVLKGMMRGSVIQRRSGADYSFCLAEGDSFGAPRIPDDEDTVTSTSPPRSATIFAGTDALILSISFDNFLRFLNKSDVYRDFLAFKKQHINVSSYMKDKSKSTRKNLVEVLKEIEYFKDGNFSDFELTRVAMALGLEYWMKGQTLFRQGAPVDSLVRIVFKGALGGESSEHGSFVIAEGAIFGGPPMEAEREREERGCEAVVEAGNEAGNSDSDSDSDCESASSSGGGDDESDVDSDAELDARLLAIRKSSQGQLGRKGARADALGKRSATVTAHAHSLVFSLAFADFRRLLGAGHRQELLAKAQAIARNSAISTRMSLSEVQAASRAFFPRRFVQGQLLLPAHAHEHGAGNGEGDGADDGKDGGCARSPLLLLRSGEVEVRVRQASDSRVLTTMGPGSLLGLVHALTAHENLVWEVAARSRHVSCFLLGRADIDKALAPALVQALREEAEARHAHWSALLARSTGSMRALQAMHAPKPPSKLPKSSLQALGLGTTTSATTGATTGATGTTRAPLVSKPPCRRRRRRRRRPQPHMQRGVTFASVADAIATAKGLPRSGVAARIVASPQSPERALRPEQIVSRSASERRRCQRSVAMLAAPPPRRRPTATLLSTGTVFPALRPGQKGQQKLGGSSTFSAAPSPARSHARTRRGGACVKGAGAGVELASILPSVFLAAPTKTGARRTNRVQL